MLDISQLRQSLICETLERNLHTVVTVQNRNTMQNSGPDAMWIVSKIPSTKSKLVSDLFD